MTYVHLDSQPDFETVPARRIGRLSTSRAVGPIKDLFKYWSGVHGQLDPYAAEGRVSMFLGSDVKRYLYANYGVTVLTDSRKQGVDLSVVGIDVVVGGEVLASGFYQGNSHPKLISAEVVRGEVKLRLDRLIAAESAKLKASSR